MPTVPLRVRLNRLFHKPNLRRLLCTIFPIEPALGQSSEITRWCLDRPCRATSGPTFPLVPLLDSCAISRCSRWPSRWQYEPPLPDLEVTLRKCSRKASSPFHRPTAHLAEHFSRLQRSAPGSMDPLFALGITRSSYIALSLITFRCKLSIVTFQVIIRLSYMSRQC